MTKKTFTIQQTCLARKTLYVDIATRERLLPPRVKARTVERYKMISHYDGEAIYQAVGVETLAWPIELKSQSLPSVTQ